MKNTIITSVIVSLLILSGTNTFAIGNDCKKTKCQKEKAKKELLKFSVNDFVGTEDHGADEILSPDTRKAETSERLSDVNKESSGEKDNGNIR